MDSSRNQESVTGHGPFVSIVSPVYQAESCVDELCRRIAAVMRGLGYSFEIILVDDGSRDRSWDAITRQAAANPEVRGYRLSRNFGQHYAITAGIHLALGDYVVILDCDLQEPPEEIPKLLKVAQNGNHIVLSRRAKREGPLLPRAGSRLFYWLLEVCSGEKFDSSIGSLSVLSRVAAQAFSSLREYYRYYLGAIHFLGFSPVIVQVQHHKRFSGRTSYSFLKRLNLAFDGVIIQSPRLLYLAVLVGLIISGFALLYMGVVIYSVLFMGFGIPGWPSLIAAVLFMGGAICSLIGIVGVYIAKMYIEIKQRPLYIIRDSTSEMMSRGRQTSIDLTGRSDG